MIYFTSDLHFGHDRDFIYKPRGFNDIIEHDEIIISNWNSIIKPSDTIYVLGDIIMGLVPKGCNNVNKLNGNIKLIFGNHDSAAKLEMYKNNIKNIEFMGYSNIFRAGKFNFYLSHYPTICSNYTDGDTLKEKIINLCGHTHTKNKFCDMDKGIIYHCELDAHNCYPISYEEILDDLKKCLSNFDLTN